MLKPSSVLHVIESMDPQMGGVCQAVRSIIGGLSKYNINNEVVCLDSDADLITGDDFPIFKIGKGAGPWHYNSTLIPWLTANFCRFDTVIVHGMWLYYSYAVNEAVKVFHNRAHQLNVMSNQSTGVGATLRFFIMPHGMLDPYFQKARSRRLKAVRNWIYWKLLERKVINNANAILFTSEAERLLAYEPFHPYRPKREVVVGLGIESPPLYESIMTQCFFEKCPEAAGTRYLLFLSRIHEKKGVDLLIKAYAVLLKSANQFNDLKLIIAGPGIESDYGKMIRLLVSSNSLLKDKVFFPGMLTGDAKWGAFYGCEAFALPSHQENFGIAVVEALACAKAVLISNQVNIWREIKESGGGIVADDTLKGTVESLNQWFELREAEQRETCRKAYLCFKQNFTKDQAAERFFHLLNDTNK